MMTLQMSAPPSFPLIVTWVYALIGVVSDTLVPFMIVVSVGLISAPLFEVHVEAEEDCEEGAEIEKRKPFLVAPESFAGFDLAIEFSEIVTIISKSHDVFLKKGGGRSPRLLEAESVKNSWVVQFDLRHVVEH